MKIYDDALHFMFGTRHRLSYLKGVKGKIKIAFFVEANRREGGDFEVKIDADWLYESVTLYYLSINVGYREDKLSFPVTCFFCSHQKPFQAIQVISMVDEKENE